MARSNKVKSIPKSSNKSRLRDTQRDLERIAESEKHKKFRERESWRVELLPKTVNQRHFINALKDSEVCAAIGPAGVGKTYCAAGVAAQMFLADLVDGFVLTRANVLRGETVGFLPGSKEDKMTPLLMPILDSLRRHLGPKVDYMLNKGQIEMLPFEYVRGRSFINKFVIIDEAQNLDEEDMIAIITRYESGRIVLLGDPFQNDLKGESGLLWLHAFAQRNGFDIPITVFQLEDIVRSGFVRSFLSHLYKENGVTELYAKLAAPSIHIVAATS
jgi:phosphate starvation-inducible PhoH-like protein